MNKKQVAGTQRRLDKAGLDKTEALFLNVLRKMYKSCTTCNDHLLIGRRLLLKFTNKNRLPTLTDKQLIILLVDYLVYAPLHMIIVVPRIAIITLAGAVIVTAISVKKKKMN